MKKISPLVQLDSYPILALPLKTLRAVVALLRETLDTWGRNEPSVHAAAISFVTLFSLVPLILLVLIVVGQAYQQLLLDRVMMEVASSLGQDAANLLEGMIASRRSTPSGPLAAGVSFVVLLFSAGGLIGRLRGSLNSMWNLTARPQSDVRRSAYVMIRQLVVPSVIVLGIGLALFASLVINTFSSLLYERHVQPFLAWLGVPTPDIGGWPAPLLNLVIFAAMFKILPQARIRWRDVLPGAALTALLFWLGNYAIQVYLTHFFTSSVYGAAGSIIVLLVWVDYSALIVLFGAAFTYAYAKTYGLPVIPDAEMMFKPGVQH